MIERRCLSCSQSPRVGRLPELPVFVWSVTGRARGRRTGDPTTRKPGVPTAAFVRLPCNPVPGSHGDRRFCFSAASTPAPPRDGTRTRHATCFRVAPYGNILKILNHFYLQLTKIGQPFEMSYLVVLRIEIKKCIIFVAVIANRIRLIVIVQTVPRGSWQRESRQRTEKQN